MSHHELIHIVIDSMPPSDHNWIDVLSALLVPIIALVGVFIAYQQYNINSQRLRHETYERRLAVYKAVQSYLSEVFRDHNTTFDRASQFLADASEAAFLFDDSVQKKIDEIYNNSIEMISIHERLFPSDSTESILDEDEKKDAVLRYNDLHRWHLEELKQSRPFFAKKLGLKVT